MRIIYGVTEEVYVLGDSRRVSYGIAAYADSNIEQTTTIITSIRDISADRAQVEQLVGFCSRLELDAVHLEEVVEDFFGQI